MNATLLLRIASVIALVFALGHTGGGPWTPFEASSAASVVEHYSAVCGGSRFTRAFGASGAFDGSSKKQKH
jgi:hypothetical protein